MVPADSNGAAAAINRAITLPCGPCKGCPPSRRASLHATGPRVRKVKWDAKAGLCSRVDHPTRIPAALCPPSQQTPSRPQRIPAHPPVHLKSPPVPPALLAKASSTSAGAPVGSLHLTLADLDARANLDWLPPLGPHADMHERFAVTLAGRSLANQRRRTIFFPPLATTSPPHRGRHGPPVGRTPPRQPLQHA